MLAFLWLWPKVPEELEMNLIFATQAFIEGANTASYLIWIKSKIYIQITIAAMIMILKVNLSLYKNPGCALLGSWIEN